MPIINLTNHPISIVKNAEYSPMIRKHIIPKGSKPIISMVIPSYTNANARYRTVKLPDFEGCPIAKKIIRGCDGLPKVEDPDNTIFIVSTAYANAYRHMHPRADMSKFYLAGEAVYSPEGTTKLGTVRLLKYEDESEYEENTRISSL